MNSLLLTGGRIIDPANHFDARADLLICQGRIAALGPEAAAQAPPETMRLDVNGRVVCPGLIDMHVHLREPGQTAKETITTGTAAAARGGFTSVLCMPNTTPAIDNSGTVALIHELAATQGRVNVFVAGSHHQESAPGKNWRLSGRSNRRGSWPSPTTVIACKTTR